MQSTTSSAEQLTTKGVIDFEQHRQDFDRIYSRQKQGDNGLRFPLVDVDTVDWRRGINANEYYSYMYRRFSCHILSRLNLSDRLDILALGCGGGSDEKNIMTLYPNSRIWSVDISVEMLERAIASKSPCQFFLAAAESLPFPSSSFDRIVSREVIEHVINPEAMLKEVYRVLKPGGRAVITTENEESWALDNNKYKSVVGKISRLFSKPDSADGSIEKSAYKDEAPTLEEFKSMSKSAGLELVEYFWDGSLYKAVPAFQHILGKQNTVKLAHFLSSLENNSKLAYLFCDQVKYIVERPLEADVETNDVFVTIPGTDTPLIRASGRYESPDSGETFTDNRGIPDLVPKVTDSESENAQLNETSSVKNKEKGTWEKAFNRWHRFVYRSILLLVAGTATLLVPSNRKHVSRVAGETGLIKYINLSLKND